jgi:antitoxin MazE
MQVSKWGNSLAIRLPKALVEALHLKAGDELTVMEAVDKTLSVAKAQRRSQALANISARGWTAPADYRFDREEANAR